MRKSDPAVRARKQALRDEVQARLAAIDARQIADSSARIRAHVLALPEFLAAKSVFAYVSMTGEIDTRALIRECLRMRKRVCVPSFDRARRKYLGVEIRDFDRDLAMGHYGILEPRDAQPSGIRCDLALVPGLAFDAKGHRLGRGKGYFDGLLKDFRGTKVALTLQAQVVAEVPVDAGDVPMDIVVTESGAIRCRA